MDTPATSDNEDYALKAEEVIQEARLTRSKKRATVAASKPGVQERAPKRRVVANHAYIAIEVKGEETKVRHRVTLR